MAEDEMVEWHHRLDGYEFEQALGDGGGQGSLVCCSSWESQRVGHDLVTEQQQQYKYSEIIKRTKLRKRLKLVSTNILK